MSSVPVPDADYFTDAEWRAFQAIPPQGYSHRYWLNRHIDKVLARAPRPVPSGEHAGLVVQLRELAELLGVAWSDVLDEAADRIEALEAAPWGAGRREIRNYGPDGKLVEIIRDGVTYHPAAPRGDTELLTDREDMPRDAVNRKGHDAQGNIEPDRGSDRPERGIDRAVGAEQRRRSVGERDQLERADGESADRFAEEGEAADVPDRSAVHPVSDGAAASSFAAAPRGDTPTREAIALAIHGGGRFHVLSIDPFEYRDRLLAAADAVLALLNGGAK